MFSRLRVACGFPPAAMALALGIAGLCGRPAAAQDFVVVPGVMHSAYGAPAAGVRHGHKDGSVRAIHRHLREASICNWPHYVLGHEDMYPYVADPYSDPRAAMGFWPPYSAPTAILPPIAGPPSR